MTITYPLAPPDLGAVRVTFAPDSVVAVAQSPFSLVEQVQEHQGQVWRASITLPPLTRLQAQAWSAFFLKLNGRAGTFTMYDPTRRNPLGAGTGTPLIKGAGQTGQYINIDGAPNGVTNYLRAGDKVQLGSGSTARMYEQLEDVNSDGSGNVALTLWPAVRTAWADNAAVTLVDAKGVFRLASMPPIDWTLYKYSVGFEAVSQP